MFPFALSPAAEQRARTRVTLTGLLVADLRLFRVHRRVWLD